MAYRLKERKATSKPPQEFGVLMLVRDRDEQKRIAEDLRQQVVVLQAEIAARTEQLDPESVQHWDAMRAERDEAVAALKKLRDDIFGTKPEEAHKRAAFARLAGERGIAKMRDLGVIK